MPCPPLLYDRDRNPGVVAAPIHSVTVRVSQLPEPIVAVEPSSTSTPEQLLLDHHGRDPELLAMTRSSTDRQ